MVTLSFSAHSFAERLAEPVQVASQTMRFPLISLDGIRYDAIQFAYATEGTLAIDDVQQVSETLLCDGERQTSTYLQVTYTGPRMVFQVRDTHSAKILFKEQLATDGSIAYGQGKCQSAGEVADRFNRQRVAWERNVHRQVVEKALQHMQDYMTNDAAPQLETLELTLFKLVNQKRFNEAADAFSLAERALNDFQQFGPTADGEQRLIEAAQKWEILLSRVADEIGRQPELKEVKRALHRNLIAVYLVTGHYERARKHDAMALHYGMPQRDSLQKRILDYEKRRILSPRVAKDMVLTANLYRFGQNAVAQAELIEMSSIAQLEASSRRR